MEWNEKDWPSTSRERTILGNRRGQINGRRTPADPQTQGKPEIAECYCSEQIPWGLRATLVRWEEEIIGTQELKLTIELQVLLSEQELSDSMLADECENQVDSTAQTATSTHQALT